MHARSPVFLLLLMSLPPGTPIDADGERCVARLEAVGRAIRAYRGDLGAFPDRLSDLVPRHLPDLASLHCPADPTAGSPGDDEGHADPRAGVSYSYELRPVESVGMASPPGPVPASDIPGKPWGSERNVMLWLRTFYGDRVPAVRCYHHGTPAGPRVLNLTLDGSIYEGSIDWKNDAETVATILEKASRDLADDPARFDRGWKLFALDDYAQGWEGSPRVLKPMRTMALGLVREATRLNDPATAYRLAARLSIHVGDFPTAEAASRKALDLPGRSEDENARQLLAESMVGQARHREAVAVFRAMRARNPESKNIRGQLADALIASGERREADDLIAAIDPGRSLVGKSAPEFRVPLLDGPETGVALALRGKKALLINFWFHRCGPCRAEFPRLQALYDARKDRGLAVIAVDSDDDRDTIARYLKSSGWTFPVALGREARGGFEIPPAYRVDIFPTNFLVDAEGKVVFRCVGWDEPGLLAALARLGVE